MFAIYLPSFSRGDVCFCCEAQKQTGVVAQRITCKFSVKLFEITGRNTRTITQIIRDFNPCDIYSREVRYTSEPPPSYLAAARAKSNVPSLKMRGDEYRPV